ncbi:MAG: hypothetical protein ACKVHU_06465 [Acidimicrobiales bacterium]
MALVGPRPTLPWEHEVLTEHHQGRIAVKPGEILGPIWTQGC